MGGGEGFAVAAPSLVSAGMTIMGAALRLQDSDTGSPVRVVGAALPGSAAGRAAEEVAAAWLAVANGMVEGLAAHGRAVATAAQDYAATDVTMAGRVVSGGSVPR